MTIIMDGKGLARIIKERVSREVAELKGRGVTPSLATILVGEDPSSHKYVSLKERDCAQVGIESRRYLFPASVEEEDIIDLIEELNGDDGVHGILIQLPLPPHLDVFRLMERISPSKDVDGLHPYNMGRLLLGDYDFENSLIPCTPKGIIRLLDHYHVEVRGKYAVIINRSNIVGKPLYKLLLDRDATVTICHSKTIDLTSHTRMADILVSAVGRRPTFTVTGDMVKEGAVVVDVGISYIGGRLVGDVEFEEVSKKASHITPMPGGVGPMTRAILLENTLLAAKKVLGV